MSSVESNNTPTNGAEGQEAAKAAAEPALLTQERIVELAEASKKVSAMPAYRLSIDGSRTPGLTDTKLGGLPYWPVGMSYPSTPEGGMLMLLAQLRLTDFGGDERLPNHGLLQFYIDAEDDCSGMDFGDATNQSHFRVVWHEEIDETVTPDEVRALGMPTSLIGFDEDYLGNPVNGEFALNVEPTTQWMTIADARYDKLFCDLCGERLGADFVAGREECYKLVGYKGFDTLAEVMSEAGPLHYVLGYPFFTQTDPRSGQLLDEFDTLLLQVDTDDEPGTRKERVCWGDDGIGGFFINGEALKRGDFSRVLFNWDCY